MTTRIPKNPENKLTDSDVKMFEAMLDGSLLARSRKKYDKLWYIYKQTHATR